MPEKCIRFCFKSFYPYCYHRYHHHYLLLIQQPFRISVMSNNPAAMEPEITGRKGQFIPERTLSMCSSESKYNMQVNHPCGLWFLTYLSPHKENTNLKLLYLHTPY